MAIRYSGQVRISCVYQDRGDYKCSVSGPDGRWSGHIRPAPAGFGRGVAYDSATAYDHIARSALAFASHDKPGIDDACDVSEAGYHIHRTKVVHAGRSATRPRSTRKAVAARATKKRAEARRRKRGVRAYYTVIVPWSHRPTAWHPTDKSFSPLNRGAFKTKDDARRWADEKLRGQPYTIKRI